MANRCGIISARELYTHEVVGHSLGYVIVYSRKKSVNSELYKLPLSIVLYGMRETVSLNIVHDRDALKVPTTANLSGTTNLLKP